MTLALARVLLGRGLLCGDAVNLVDVNEDPALADTFLGDLVVLRHGNSVAVAVADRFGRGNPRIIHLVEPGRTVWDAMPGKHPLVHDSVRRLYGWRDELDEQRATRNDQLHAADFRREWGRVMQRNDARDVLLGGG